MGDATNTKKKLAISEFIRDKHGIRLVDAVQEVLTYQFIKTIDEDCILELEQRIQEWNGCTLLGPLTHVCTKYTTMDNLVYNKTMKRFTELPDNDLPLNKYFTKQDECQLIASNFDNLISSASMVLQLTTYMGATEMINRSVTKVKHQVKPDKTWKKSKTWFLCDLKAIIDKATVTGIEPGYQSNMSVNVPLTRYGAREELTKWMRESFGKLTHSVVVKSGMINAHTTIIAAQAKDIVELTAINAILVAVLTTKGSITLTPPQDSTAQGAGTANTMGHTVNTAGVACPTKKKQEGMDYMGSSPDLLNP